MKQPSSSWKTLRIILILLLVVVVGIQFIRAPLENPPVTGDFNGSPEVKAILERACYNCHSNQTRLAWFDEIVPAYWVVAKDVRAARAVVDFSNWDSLSKSDQGWVVYESISEIEQHAMPLSDYTFLHHGGIVTADEINVLKKYALNWAHQPKPDTAIERATAMQYAQWIAVSGGGRDSGAAPAGAARLGPVKDEINGIAYADMAHWMHWEQVSTTDRFDIGTLMTIRGNAIAIQAIREGHTSPYPDGSILAKTAYVQNTDSSGEIHVGPYLQVEFMIRDSKKYAASLGWGWARWVGGLAMQPYGKNPSFVTECMNCHRPYAKTDYTFTFPIVDTLRLYDQGTALPDSLGGLPLRGKLITQCVNIRGKTTSSLFGNAIATRSAWSGGSYAPGSVVSLVSWSERDDAHWFGARIAGEVISVETLRFGADGKPEYASYAGPGLEKKTLDSGAVAQRVQYITAQRAAVVSFGALDDRPDPGK